MYENIINIFLYKLSFINFLNQEYSGKLARPENIIRFPLLSPCIYAIHLTTQLINSKKKL